jgi:hypothetical protein
MQRQMVEDSEPELGMPSKQVHKGGTVDCPRLQRLQWDDGIWMGRAGEDGITNHVCKVDEQERPRRLSGGPAGGERALPNRRAFLPSCDGVTPGWG